MKIFRPLSIILVLLIALVQVIPSEAQTVDTRLIYEKMANRVANQNQVLIDFRHDLHQHPELSGAETRTADRIAKYLTELGFDVRTGIGGHGVLGILEGALPGPAVAFRADMDAVRSNSPDPVAYRSLTSGVRHICGHDVHTTIGIGLAEGFAAIQSELAGSILLVFQPAEERGTGANAVLADGIFDSIKPDAIFAVHTAPYNVGQVATMPGGMMAGRASVLVTISGRGDVSDAETKVRAAIMNVGNHPPERATQSAPKGFIMVQLFQSRATGRTRRIQGQIMTAGPEDRSRAKSAVAEAISNLDLDGITIKLEYDERFMEGVTNEKSLVTLANDGIAAFAPEVEIRVSGGAVPMFSEDFGSFQAQVPGVMYFLGVSNPEAGTVGMPHTPNYVADDASIAVGTRVMLAAMFTRLLAD